MEAQYGLQKKKAMIPLMMQEGYEADGWLGLLLGTSLWYALYGSTLESESAFEDRMSALSREIGSRGRADAVVADVPEPCPEQPSSQSAEAASLRSELQSMRLTALQKRAVSEGVSADVVDDAMDGDDPKASLIALIVELASCRGPADRLLSALQAGGDTAADVLSAALDHAMDVLEQLSVSSPRKSRKPVRELLESVEGMSESVDADWCDGLSRCSSDRLEALVSQIVAVQGLAADQAASDCVSLVSALLAALRECGSVAVQCESLLSVDSEEEARLGALECVRSLSLGRLSCVSESEASLFGVLQDHVFVDLCELSCEERLSCWLSLYVLGCRNGVAVVARVDQLEPFFAAMNASVELLGAAVAAGDMDAELRACAAVHAAYSLLGHETGTKSAPNARAEIDAVLVRCAKPVLAVVARLTVVSFAKLIARVAELRLLEQQNDENDVSVGCGTAFMVAIFGIVHAKPIVECDTDALFGGAAALLRRICPSSLPTDWWVSTCADVDVTSLRLGSLMMFFGGSAKVLDQATLESASWLGPVTAEAVHICKVNASAGLSARPTMSFLAVAYALALAEQAARVESHAASMLESGVLGALDYACANDFSFLGGISVAGNAAGAAVALVGRNEGGRTLSPLAINPVLTMCANNFDPTHWRYTSPAKRLLPYIRRVATVAIADANKKTMLQQEKLLDTLVAGLLLDDDNPRRGQDGADALQEACAGVLHELALYGPGAAALRAHKPTMDALRVLAESGTKESRERAAGALFELDEETRAAKTTQAADTEQHGSSKPPPHVMVSYNWDHQHVILRVVAWLQAHGYLVWVDTEQMKGSTVDAMALAVEGSEVMLIGVSRPYKESSNCRMEAQYGLQKKKAMIPLMMQEGYEADGWLGLLLGTSLWYALYGSTLESESAFEDRMSALSREIGSRGRADAVVASSQSEEPAPEPDAEESDVAALRSELEGMRLRALERRALSDGLSPDAVDDAMDGDDPKAALIALIVMAASSRGPAERLLSALQAGGDTAADVLAPTLDHATDVLEQLSVSSPRKSRKLVRELLESVEDLSDTIDKDWCDGVSQCSSDRLEALLSQIVAVEGMAADQAASDCSSLVSALLDSLRECGSVVVQCESVLCGGAECDETARLGALDCVRGLSTDRLHSVSDSEASLFGVLKDHLCGSESAMSCQEQLSCWLSAFVLGCRNGVSVVARVDVLEPLMAALDMSVASLGAVVASGSTDGAIRVCSAAHLCALGLVGFEAAVKSPPDMRAPVEKRFIELAKPYFGGVAKAFSAESFGKVIAEVVKLQVLGQDREGASLACGALNTLGCVAVVFPKSLAEYDSETLFGGVLTLLRTVCPSPLPAEWWVSTCDKVDVTSVRLGLLTGFFASSLKLLDQATLESASWLGPALAEAVHICKVNASAGLSARPTMSFFAVAYMLTILETAARVESHATWLLDSGGVEALDYACVNDFSYNGQSVTKYAAGAVVALVGRNEGGKTLSRSTVNTVLDGFAAMFDPTHWRYTYPVSRVITDLPRIATVAISDANKKIMLQHDKLLSSLVAGLLLDDDNPRRGQDGADTMQEACAGVLHELALYGPGAAALREHTPTMDALRVLAESGTKESRERAAGALFELDEETRAAKTTALDAEAGASKPPPHIMVSYNWDHQHVILRVVAWLQAHGYLVWVDTEQMKGSTVDAMALAVEGSEVMLIGVSRPYKESSNCRMEAQYGLQKKKAMIPLMMQEGYEADGWLGLLLGTSLWYALYGDALSSESAFEDRMSALSREIGSRGRADAVVADDAPEPCPEPDESEEVAALRTELGGMRLMALQKRAVSDGASADAVEDAMEGDDPKASLIALIVEAASRRGPADQLLSALQAGGETAADTVSAVLDHAMDVLEEVSRSSPRKSRKAVRSLLESVEELSESVDDAWCDGMARCTPDRLDALVSSVMPVQALLPGGAAEVDCILIVSSLLDAIRECGSVVVQCESVLTVGAGSDESARLGALECVRGLSPASLVSVSESEASLLGVLTTHLCSEDTLITEERLSCLLSVFVLGCRNGVSVVARVDVLEPMFAAMDMSVASLCASVGSGSFDDALRVYSAAHLCGWGLVGWEAATKSTPDVRVPVEKRNAELVKSYFGGLAKAFSAESCGKVITEVIELRLLEQDGEGASLGCGALNIVSYFAAVFPKAMVECDTEAVFGGALTLLRNVCPSPLPAEWWVSTCAEVDVTSVRVALLMHFFGANTKLLDLATLESASWLGPALAEAVHICKVNASAGLSARPTMSFFAVTFALNFVEPAARVQSHAASLLDSGVLEALDYACVNDFSFIGVSVSSNAAGAVVALVGRNEGGKTLSRSTVDAVLDSLARYFDPADWFHTMPAARLMSHLRRVATVAIADANKKIMLQYDKLLDTLVAGLLLDDDNPRRGQDGADALQEGCAGVLHELALYGPGAAALRAHKRTMDALRVLAESGTKGSRERAAGALFELDEETRAAKTTAKADDADSGASKPPPHIMVSYNWDHQHVILRVVAWLQAHGYLVWVDTEQMKGSTVDAMALAVEGSEVMLIGVSRPYKESSNCRMEAQYGLQKKKAMIPLMMQEGYEADGWLGLLLGTSLWYALYGSTLESESAFEDRMSALSREIGSRGRADAVAQTKSSPLGPVSQPSPQVDGELELMKPSALKRRARAAGCTEAEIEEADDADDPKAAMIALILSHEASGQETSDVLRRELEGLKPSALKRRARAAGATEQEVEEADDAQDPSAAMVELIVSRAN
eukprot:COSAG04_NODE_800_length_10199_cov_36.147327_1_plen_2772_part_10